MQFASFVPIFVEIMGAKLSGSRRWSVPKDAWKPWAESDSRFGQHASSSTNHHVSTSLSWQSVSVHSPCTHSVPLMANL